MNALRSDEQLPAAQRWTLPSAVKSLGLVAPASGCAATKKNILSVTPAPQDFVSVKQEDVPAGAHPNANFAILRESEVDWTAVQLDIRKLTL